MQNRQIGRLRAVEDLPGVDAGLAIDFSDAASIAHQAAGNDVFASVVRRRHGIMCRQRDELIAPRIEKRVGVDEECAGSQLRESRERRVDFLCGAAASP